MELAQGELDALLICLPFEEPGVVTLPLYDESFMVTVPAKHAWVKRKTIATDDFATETVLLLGAGHCIRDQVMASRPELHRAAGGRRRFAEGGGGQFDRDHPPHGGLRPRPLRLETHRDSLIHSPTACALDCVIRLGGPAA